MKLIKNKYQVDFRKIVIFGAVDLAAPLSASYSGVAAIRLLY